jgi:hypothetical protein
MVHPGCAACCWCSFLFFQKPTAAPHGAPTHLGKKAAKAKAAKAKSKVGAKAKAKPAASKVDLSYKAETDARKTTLAFKNWVSRDGGVLAEFFCLILFHEPF